VRTDQLRAEFQLDCQYRVFPLHPETPDAGMSLQELFGDRMDIPAAMAHLSQVAASLGLPFGARTHTYNSRKAQELGLWVAEQGQFEAYLKAIYHAYFVAGSNIAQPEELLKIVTGLGLDRVQAQQLLAEQSYAAALDKELAAAINSGIRAVPTLRCEGRELVGFQTLEACRQLITG